jgi:hypothetical protein
MAMTDTTANLADLIAQLERVEQQCMEKVMEEAAREEDRHPCECPSKSQHRDNCPHATTDDCEWETPRGLVLEAIEAIEALLTIGEREEKGND